jgi:anti-sigma factor RsiW
MESETKKSACRKWQIILGEYVLGTVDERDRGRLKRHLSRCDRCRRELAEMEEMYRLLGDFELAKPGPFFAAKVAHAVRNETEAAAPGAMDEGALAGLRRWMRRPAVASAVAAASIAAVAAILYVKVWQPRASREPTMPPAGEVASKTGKLAAAPVREKETAPAERRTAEETRGTRAGTRARDELALPLTEIAASEERAVDEPAALAEGRPVTEPRGGRAGAGMADEAASRRYEIAATDEILTGALKAKSREDDVAEEPYPVKTPSEADELTVAPLAAAAYARDYDAGVARRGVIYTADAEQPAWAGLEEGTLTAADVEARMDARFEADVERLTRGGVALVDYVTPNGLLMTYFYELPVEEQKTVLSRLRREAETATAAELLLSH